MKHDWLHYDRVVDAVFCHLCLTMERENRFLASTKCDPAFISKGYTNWKDATTARKTHLASQCHKQAIAVKELPKQTGDVGGKLSTGHQLEKAKNRAMFQRIFQNVCFLARQGLWLGGHKDGADSNFTQLLYLRAFDSPAVLTWMKKKTEKYTSSDIQNESILRQISECIFLNYGQWIYWYRQQGTISSLPMLGRWMPHHPRSGLLECITLAPLMQTPWRQQFAMWYCAWIWLLDSAMGSAMMALQTWPVARMVLLPSFLQRSHMHFYPTAMAVP